MSREQAVQMSDRFQHHACHFRGILFVHKRPEPALLLKAIRCRSLLCARRTIEAEQEMSNFGTKLQFFPRHLIYHKHFPQFETIAFSNQPVMN